MDWLLLQFSLFLSPRDYYISFLHQGWIQKQFNSWQPNVKVRENRQRTWNVKFVVQHCWVESRCCAFYHSRSNLLTSWFVARQVWTLGGKTCHIVIPLVLQQYCKTSCTFYVPPFFRTLRVHNGISKICLIRLVFIYIFFFWKSSQPSFSVLFRKQKIDRKWYPSFFKNDSTCKLYVHNYIIISVYRDFQNMCGTQYFIFAGYPFRSPGCCSWMTYHFICAFYLSLLFYRRCSYYSLNYLCQNFGKSLLLTILEKKKFGFFVWSTLNLADFVEYH